LQRLVRTRSTTRYCPPIPGWAGICIAMCTCKPEVEVNLLRLPGISKVVWEDPGP